MVVQADSSLKGKSSDELKQMLEQTSIVEAEPEEETAEAVEITEEEAETSTEVETLIEEPAKEKEAEPGKKLYKIKVGGKEKEVNLEKLIAYAQQAEDYSGKMHKFNEEKRKLEEEKAKLNQPLDWSKLNEQFVDMLQKDPLGTLNMYDEAKRKSEKAAEAEEKRIERAFISEKKELPHWVSIESTYQDLRDSGKSRDEAFVIAENEFLKGITATLREKGFKEGIQKASMKEKAAMPIAEKKTKGGAMPTPEEFKNMTSEQLAKHLKYTKTPGW